MFTGIIEEVGSITNIQTKGENRRITIAAENTSKELQEGHSVAVSGVCLTALDVKPGVFSADLAPETWARTLPPSCTSVQPRPLNLSIYR